MSKKLEPTAPKTIVLTLTVYPPKNGKRRILVSGAPEGEMPAVLNGLFADRHVLLDQLWATLQKRKPQVVKVRGGKDTKTNDDANTEHVADADKPDQLVRSEAASAELTPPADLPEIEDDHPQLALPLEDSTNG